MNLNVLLWAALHRVWDKNCAEFWKQIVWENTSIDSVELCNLLMNKSSISSVLAMAKSYIKEILHSLAKVISNP